ncbi:MAG: hypothetical protein JWO60_3420 [Frankiales bacterium]|nr:hypothetical protein [Frankiales bacterium]
MTTPPTPEMARGTRRAAAFLLHNGNRDLDGVNAILTELNGESDTLNFLLGIGYVFESLLPIMYSQAGQWLVRETIGDLAGIEHGGEVQ